MNTTDLKEKLNILAVGAKDMEYPMFAQNITFTPDGDVFTCNSDTFVRLSNIDSPFVGTFNFFVLRDVLSKTSELEVVKGSKSYLLKNGNIKYRLNYMPMPVPDLSSSLLNSESLRDSVTLTEDLIISIKKAFKFINLSSTKLPQDEAFSYVYVSNNAVASSDVTSAAFYENISEEPSGKKYLLSKSMLPFLKEGVKLSGTSNHLVLSFKDGSIAFTTYKPSDFKIDQVIFSVKSTSLESKLICNDSALFTSQLDKLTPVLHGEKDKVVSIEIKNGVAKLIAGSAHNGISTIEFEIDQKEVEVNVEVAIPDLKKIDFGHKCFISKDRLVFLRGNSTIVLLNREN